MDEKVLIAKAKMDTEDGQKVPVKVYLGNIVEYPDGTQKSLPEEIYRDIEKKWRANSSSKNNSKESQTENETVQPEPVKEEITEETAVKEDLGQRPEIENEKLEAISEKEDVTDESSVKEKNEDSSEFQGEVVGNIDKTEVFRETEIIELETKEDVKQEEISEKAQDKTVKKDKPSQKSSLKLSKAEKEIKKLKVIIVGIVAVFSVVAGCAIAWYNGFLPIPQFSITQEQDSDKQSKYFVYQTKDDISRGSVVTEDALRIVGLTEKQYKKMSASTYVSADGSTATASLMTVEDKDEVVGKFASRDLPEGTYISLQDITNQTVVAEKNFVDVEVDGKTYSVAVDGTSIMGQTSVKIVALIDSDTREGTIAIALGEFVLEDRTLQDVFDSAGQSILEQLAGENKTENNNN